jgi:hypothetical protein
VISLLLRLKLPENGNKSKYNTTSFVILILIIIVSVKNLAVNITKMIMVLSNKELKELGKETS